MSKFKVGDKVECYRDTSVEEMLRTGIWYFPDPKPRDIGMKGTVVGIYWNNWMGKEEIHVHIDGTPDNTVSIVIEDDFRKIKNE